MVTKDHLKLVLSGQKDLLKMNEVRFINPPAFDEIGVKNLYDKVVSLPKMDRYFPSKYPKGRQCCRSYMYNVWNTLHPDDVNEVIMYANRQRYDISAEKVKQESIIITDKWMQELEALPFISKQKGRMSALLKQKSKVQAVPKDRVQYEPFDFQKRARDEELRLHQAAQARLAKEDTIKIEGKKHKITAKVLEKHDEPM